MISLRNLTDRNGQRGQFFGAAVAVSDLNNDGYASILLNISINFSLGCNIANSGKSLYANSIAIVNCHI